MKLQAASERERLAQTAQSFFEERWRDRDPWEVEDSELDQASYACQVALLEGERYGSVLELGCGSGSFTQKLADIADRVLAVDIAPSAIERARELQLGPRTVEFRIANSWTWTCLGRVHGTSS
jgi:SAM-dependent methyltransferase